MNVDVLIGLSVHFSLCTFLVGLGFFGLGGGGFWVCEHCGLLFRFFVLWFVDLFFLNFWFNCISFMSSKLFSGNLRQTPLN